MWYVMPFSIRWLNEWGSGSREMRKERHPHSSLSSMVLRLSLHLLAGVSEAWCLGHCHRVQKEMETWQTSSKRGWAWGEVRSGTGSQVGVGWSRATPTQLWKVFVSWCCCTCHPMAWVAEFCPMEHVWNVGQIPTRHTCAGATGILSTTSTATRT